MAVRAGPGRAEPLVGAADVLPWEPDPMDEDPMYVWRIKSQANEDARCSFDGYVPQIRELGLEIPDPAPRKDDATDLWPYTELDWDKLRAVVTGHGPGVGRAHLPSARRATRGVGRAGGARGGRVIFEVFRAGAERQPRPSHAGHVLGADERFGEIYAREQYGRRQESTAISARAKRRRPRDRRVSGRVRIRHRRVDGYSDQGARPKEARERAGIGLPL